MVFAEMHEVSLLHRLWWSNPAGYSGVKDHRTFDGGQTALFGEEMMIWGIGAILRS